MDETVQTDAPGPAVPESGEADWFELDARYSGSAWYYSLSEWDDWGSSARKEG